jgi:hypothetical protein
MNNDRLWLEEEFRRQYPLTAQRLQELNEQEQADLADRQYRKVLQDLHVAAGLSEKELLKLGAEDVYSSSTEETPKEKEKQGNLHSPADEAREYEKERKHHT